MDSRERASFGIRTAGLRSRASRCRSALSLPLKQEPGVFCLWPLLIFAGWQRRTPFSRAEDSPIAFICELKKQVRNGPVLLGESQLAISFRADAAHGASQIPSATPCIARNSRTRQRAFMESPQGLRSHRGLTFALRSRCVLLVSRATGNEERGASVPRSVTPLVETSRPPLQPGRLSVLLWLTRQAVDPGL